MLKNCHVASAKIQKVPIYAVFGVCETGSNPVTPITQKTLEKPIFTVHLGDSRVLFLLKIIIAKR